MPEAEVLDAAMAEARRLAERRTGAWAGTKRNLRGEMIERTLAGVVADMEQVDIPKV